MATGRRRLPSGPGHFARFTIDAAVLRYRFLGARGVAFFLVSVFDIVLYAAAIFLVVSTVFGLTGIERFGLLLVGLLVFRWSLSCAIQASRVARFAGIARPMQPHPVAATAMLALAPPTLIFMVSAVLLIVFLSVSADGFAGLFHVMVWGALVVAAQLVWNIVIILCVSYARIRNVIMSETPIVLLFGLGLIVSPVAFQFSDIPNLASGLLTSFNPASHLIAGYHNAWWYGEVVSLKILPASLLPSAALIALLLVLMRREFAGTSRAADTPDRRSCFHWNGRYWSSVPLADLPDGAAFFDRWRGEMPWLTGEAVVHLLRPGNAEQLSAKLLFERLAPESSDAIFDTPLPVISERARNRICALVAIREVTRPVVLDRVIDNADRDGAQRFIDTVGRFRRDSTPIYVIVGDDQIRSVFERAMFRLTDAPTVIGLRNA